MNSLEKKSLFRFVVLYLCTVLVFVVTICVIYFFLEKHRIVERYDIKTRQNKGVVISSLMRGQECSSFDVSFAIYSKDVVLCNTLGDFQPERFQSGIYTENYRVYFVSKVPPRILENGFMVLQSASYKEDLFQIVYHLFLFFFVSLLFFTATGWFLAKLILHPWKLAKEQLENFIKDATHDLKTPISAAMLSLERLQNVCHEIPSSHKYINYAQSSVKTLLLLYEDLVYINFKNRSIQRIGEIDVSTLLLERISFFEPLFEQKSLTVERSIEPLVVTVSYKDITRVIDNLLSNSIKYNHVGGKVSVMCKDKCVQICDNGRGIDQANFERVFERFERGDVHRDGFGLGLAIVKEICDRNAIKITLQSKKGEGSCFSLYF